MFVLTVQQHRSEANEWQVDMDLERISSVVTDPLAGLPLYDTSIDENVVAYLIAAQGEHLRVAVAHEITTGRTSQITTDISHEIGRNATYLGRNLTTTHQEQNG